jgi:hypothetical protein
MLNALNRVERYRDLAEGCRRLAAIGFSNETRNHYLRMAEQNSPQQEVTMRARPKTIRALLIAGVAVCAIASPLVNICVIPAAAQAVSLSVEFRTALEPYGAWQHHRRWGEVWIPSRVARNWQPYTVGHWVYSQDYGWYWAPDDQEADWGLVTYHYGRWVVDDQFGWMWIPGTEWGPGWVQWRHGRQHVGWAPLPPDEVMVEYREAPQFWVFVRERDLVAPRITEVILPPQERGVFFRDTIVVNRTVVLQDRRFGVNPGIPPTYIAAAYGRPIPSYEISPRVFAGTANLPGAVVVRADDFRNRERVREIARESTFVRQTTNTVAPARELPPLQPLGASERGRLGALPPRAAQPGFTVTGQNRPEGSNAPATSGREPPTGQSPNPPAPSRQGAAPGQPLQQHGREGRPGAQGAAPSGPGPAQGELRGNQGQRDQRNLREGRPVAPNAPGTAPSISGIAPGAQRNEGPGGAQPGRDQRNLREGRPGSPLPNAPSPSGEARRVPEAGAPGERGPRNPPPGGIEQRGGRDGSGLVERGGRTGNLPGRESGPGTSGAAPSGRERELRNRPPEGATSPQELHGRERSGIESQGPRNQSAEGQRGATQRLAPAALSQPPLAAGRGSSPGSEAPRSRAPAAEGPRSQSPTTAGAAPGAGRAAPGGGGRREEQR